jgi:phosphoribosylformimino-5-aminoimidazole carboxamide ribotide isomerase
MRIVGVIDLRNGLAVRAHGGTREAYVPVRDVAGVDVFGDAVALARVYVEQLGVRELYVADLDAISAGIGALNSTTLRALAKLGVPMMVDAGVSSPCDARAVLDMGATAVIVGLETLPSFNALDAICASVGGERVAFSLDLRDGKLLAQPNVTAGWTLAEVAQRAAAAGVGALIVLDVARVGTGAGIDLEVMRAVRTSAPAIVLFAGGGIRSSADVDALADAGCDGALVATALQLGLMLIPQSRSTGDDEAERG